MSSSFRDSRAEIRGVYRTYIGHLYIYEIFQSSYPGFVMCAAVCAATAVCAERRGAYTVFAYTTVRISVFICFARWKMYIKRKGNAAGRTRHARSVPPMPPKRPSHPRQPTRARAPTPLSVSRSSAEAEVLVVVAVEQVKAFRLVDPARAGEGG